MERRFNYVYVTTNLINGKQYVGDRSCDCDPKIDPYFGSGRPYFKRALNEYKKENFKKEVLEIFPTRLEAFNAQEKYIIEFNTLIPNGYNISPKGGHLFKGSMSNETKRKIGNANKISLKGHKLSEESIQKRLKTIKGRPSPLIGKKQSIDSITKRAKSNTGKKRTLAQRENMKVAQQNRKPLTTEQRKHISDAKKGKIPWMKGKHHTKETKKIIAEKQKGRIFSKETRMKISKSQKGKIISKETREKMSLASKGKPKADQHKNNLRKAMLGKKYPKIYCIFCKKEYAVHMFKLYHGDNCKSKDI